MVGTIDYSYQVEAVWDLLCLHHLVYLRFVGTGNLYFTYDLSAFCGFDLLFGFEIKQIKYQPKCH